jgi:hypothetical protein
MVARESPPKAVSAAPNGALSLPKTSSGGTACASCASGRRDVRVPDQAPARRTIPTEVTARLEAENLVLRQQVIVLSRKSQSRVLLRNLDRLIFVWLYRFFPAILNAITVVKPETVIRWHRRGFRAFWHLGHSRRRNSRAYTVSDAFMQRSRDKACPYGSRLT